MFIQSIVSKEFVIKYRVLLSLIFFLVVHIPISFIYVNPVDVLTQYHAAIDIVRGYDLYENLEPRLGKPYPTYPPVYLYYLAFLFFIFGGNLIVLKTQLIIANTFLALTIYKLSYELFEKNSDYAFYTLLLFIISPINYLIVYGGFFDNFVILFLCISYLFVISEKKFSAIYAGIFLSISIMSKQFGVIFIPIYLLYYFFKKNRLKLSLQFMTSLILTTVIIALPFINRSRFIRDQIYHLNDGRPSISWQYRLFPELDQFSLIIQFTFMAIVFFVMFYLLFKLHKIGKLDKITLNNFFIWSIHVIMLIFMLFNRIVYPHYLPYISYLLPFIIIDYYKFAKSRTQILINLFFYVILGIGMAIYGYAWLIYREGMEINDLYWYFIGSLVYNIGMLLFAFHSLYLMVAMFKLRPHTDT